MIQRESKKIEVIEDIIFPEVTVAKGTDGELITEIDAFKGISKKVIFRIPRKESFPVYFNKYFSDLTPEISSKIKEMEK